MNKCVENLNKYLNAEKIKRTFICVKTGMNESKVSRILSGTQEMTIKDFEMIASALGKRVDFFIGDNLIEALENEHRGGEVAFYAGEPTVEQQHFAEKIVTMMECMDDILGAEVMMYKAYKG